MPDVIDAVAHLIDRVPTLEQIIASLPRLPEASVIAAYDHIKITRWEHAREWNS